MDIRGLLDALGLPKERAPIPVGDFLHLLDRFQVPWRLRCRVRLETEHVIVGLEEQQARPRVSARTWWHWSWYEHPVLSVRETGEAAWDVEVGVRQPPEEEDFIELQLDGRTVEVPILPAAAALLTQYGWSDDSVSKTGDMLVTRDAVWAVVGGAP